MTWLDYSPYRYVLDFYFSLIFASGILRFNNWLDFFISLYNSTVRIYHNVKYIVLLDYIIFLIVVYRNDDVGFQDSSDPAADIFIDQFRSFERRELGSLRWTIGTCPRCTSQRLEQKERTRRRGSRNVLPAETPFCTT